MHTQPATTTYYDDDKQREEAAEMAQGEPAKHLWLAAPGGMPIQGHLGRQRGSARERLTVRRNLGVLALLTLGGAALMVLLGGLPDNMPVQIVALLCAVAIVFLCTRLQATQVRRAQTLAVTDERLRLAGELHDLVMQDLALSLAYARDVRDDPTRAEQATNAVEAGERALKGARDVLRALTHADETPVVEALSASVRSAARQRRVSFETSIQAGTHTDRVTQETLIHIAREAVTNAVKHARSKSIEVSLEHDDEWQLVVRDDGRGFHTELASEGFGLQSMRARAKAAGGSVEISSDPRLGTVVRALLP